MLGYCPLGSGSRGNCIYVGTSKTKILVDAGLSAKITEERLAAIGVSLDAIDAIIISHEHADHIQGLKGLAVKRQIPVLANSETAKAIIAQIPGLRFKIFSTGDRFTLGSIEIHPFSIPHDTVDPVAFTLQCGDVKLAICTDLGYVSRSTQEYLQGCDYLYVEANHEPSMVHASGRPDFLKKRILGRTGHLSNRECGLLLCQVANPRLKHVHLAHLSSECNAPVTALSVVREELSKIGLTLPIDVASQNAIGTPIYFENSTPSV